MMYKLAFQKAATGINDMQTIYTGSNEIICYQQFNFRQLFVNQWI